MAFLSYFKTWFTVLSVILWAFFPPMVTSDIFVILNIMFDYSLRSVCTEEHIM